MTITPIRPQVIRKAVAKHEKRALPRFYSLGAKKHLGACALTLGLVSPPLGLGVFLLTRLGARRIESRSVRHIAGLVNTDQDRAELQERVDELEPKVQKRLSLQLAKKGIILLQTIKRAVNQYKKRVWPYAAGSGIAMGLLAYALNPTLVSAVPLATAAAIIIYSIAKPIAIYLEWSGAKKIAGLIKNEADKIVLREAMKVLKPKARGKLTGQLAGRGIMI